MYKTNVSLKAFLWFLLGGWLMSASAQEYSLKITRPIVGERLTITNGATFVIGSAVPPSAEIFVNGVRADVSEDGAFIAMAPLQFLPEPDSFKLSDGRSARVDAVFDFVMRADGKEITRKVFVSTPRVQVEPVVPMEPFPEPQVYRVREEQILSQLATTNWGVLHLPEGAQVIGTARQGKKICLRVGDNQETWVEEGTLERGNSAPKARDVTVTNLGPYETRVTVGAPVPFALHQLTGPSRVQVTLYAADTNRVVEIASPQGGSWGFAGKFRGGELIVTQRRGPDPVAGLKGKRICLDPGHNPDPGAIGPRGLMEREANLKVGLELEKLLKAAGAAVEFTHRAEPMPLRDRRLAALRHNPDIFISLHNNSVPDGTDPRTHNGTSTFYYHPQSLALARCVQQALLADLNLRDEGVNRKSLYVCRISEFPSILVEPLYIILPDHEWLLLTEDGPKRIAKAIFEGVGKSFENEGRAIGSAAGSSR